MVTLSNALAQLFPNATIGLGGDIELADGQITAWRLPEQQPTTAEIAAAELPAAKAAAIAANRADCSRRIFARYPAGRQLSALAGLYDGANVATMTDWISDMVAAENTAADAIEAATTVQAVEAVTVAWPA